MKTLYLLRHTHAEDAAPVPMGDHERILSPQGKIQAAAIGAYMKGAHIFPDFVLSSSSVRTIQTVRIVFGEIMTDEGLSVRSHFDRALYLAGADVLRAHIEEVSPAVENLLVVAHNPGLAELAYALSNKTLADHTTDYGPGTLAIFRANLNDWRDISPEALSLEKVFTPPGS